MHSLNITIGISLVEPTPWTSSWSGIFGAEASQRALCCCASEKARRFSLRANRIKKFVLSLSKQWQTWIVSKMFATIDASDIRKLVGVQLSVWFRSAVRKSNCSTSFASSRSNTLANCASFSGRNSTAIERESTIGWSIFTSNKVSLFEMFWKQTKHYIFIWFAQCWALKWQLEQK